MENINLLDLFLLDYCGVNIIFQIANIDKDYVYIYELKTKKRRIDGILCDTLSKKLVASDNPLIVPKEVNCYSKTTYKVKPILLPGYEEYMLPIKIDVGSKIFNTLVNEYNVLCPLTGYLYAYKLEEFRNVAWECREKPKKEQEIYYA